MPVFPKTFGKLGKMAGNLVNKVFGNGDYVMNKNPLIQNSLIANNQPITFNGD